MKSPIHHIIHQDFPLEVSREVHLLRKAITIINIKDRRFNCTVSISLIMSLILCLLALAMALVTMTLSNALFVEESCEVCLAGGFIGNFLFLLRGIVHQLK